MNASIKSTALLACLVTAAGLLGACQQRSAEEAGASSGGSSAGTAQSSSGGMAEGAKEASSDTAITAKVKAALMRDSRVNSTDISVETNKGEVVLSGFVDSQPQIEHAMQVARNVEGVSKVTNKMKPRR